MYYVLILRAYCTNFSRQSALYNPPRPSLENYAKAQVQQNDKTPFGPMQETKQ